MIILYFFNAIRASNTGHTARTHQTKIFLDVILEVVQMNQSIRLTQVDTVENSDYERFLIVYVLLKAFPAYVRSDMTERQESVRYQTTFNS